MNFYVLNWCQIKFQYYPAFIISDLCYKMLEDAHESNISIIDEPESKEDSVLCTPPASGETNIAKAHLDHVDEKLQNKVQALKALQVSVKVAHTVNR